MVALQIRDVPEDVRQALADQAAARGQSLQGFLLRLVTDEAVRSTNLAILDQFDGRSDGSRLSFTEVTEALDSQRREREAVLSRVDDDLS